MRDLRAALTAAGVRTSTLVLGPATDPPDGVQVVAESAASLPRRLLAYARAARRAARDHDVVDAHFALFAWWPVVFGGLRGRPLVVHFQGPWSAESLATGGRAARGAAIKTGLERAVYRRADRLIVLSDAFRDLLIRDYGVAPWLVRVVPPGVDLSRFTPDRVGARERLGIADHERLVFSARRLVPRMGLDVLLDAFDGLARSGEGLTLAIAGEGPVLEQLHGQAIRLRLDDVVRLLGRVDEEVLLDHYRAADVVVLPSLALNYMGQGVLLLADPSAVESPLYRLVPDELLVPLVLLATAAAVIGLVT